MIQAPQPFYTTFPFVLVCVCMPHACGFRELLGHARAVAPNHVPAYVAAAALESRFGNAERAASLYEEAAAAAAAIQAPGRAGGMRAEGMVPTSWGAQAAPAAGASAGDLGGTNSSQDAAADTDTGAAAAAAAVGGGSSDATTPGGAAASAAKGAAHATLDDNPPSTAASSSATRRLTPGSSAGSSSAVVLHARALHALRAGLGEEAEALLQRLEDLAPGNGHLCHTRGLLAQRAGQLELAESWFRRGAGGSVDDGVGALLCYEGLAELLAFQVRAPPMALHVHPREGCELCVLQLVGACNNCSPPAVHHSRCAPTLCPALGPH
jgi:hypothetical protein